MSLLSFRMDTSHYFLFWRGSLPQIATLADQTISNRCKRCVHCEIVTQTGVVRGGDADVTFKSCDGVLFRIHKINLEVCAGGFAPPEFDVQGEIVCLTETAMTLKLLFRFCYPECHPDVEAMEFDVLIDLAEAAEKYEVYSAMNICKIYMK
jgi:hypothetical protein